MLTNVHGCILIFHVDPMMGEHVQTFIFASPFNARRVRIRPLDSGDGKLLCLRLELIGGRLLGKYVIQGREGTGAILMDFKIYFQ